MRTHKVEKNAENIAGIERSKLLFRFLDEDHHALIRAAAKDAGLSINAWIVQATLREARKQLAASRLVS